jgi:hypothetical protein
MQPLRQLIGPKTQSSYFNLLVLVPVLPVGQDSSSFAPAKKLRNMVCRTTLIAFMVSTVLLAGCHEAVAHPACKRVKAFLTMTQNDGEWDGHKHGPYAEYYMSMRAIYDGGTQRSCSAVLSSGERVLKRNKGYPVNCAFSCDKGAVEAHRKQVDASGVASVVMDGVVCAQEQSLPYHIQYWFHEADAKNPDERSGPFLFTVNNPSWEAGSCCVDCRQDKGSELVIFFCETSESKTRSLDDHSKVDSGSSRFSCSNHYRDWPGN